MIYPRFENGNQNITIHFIIGKAISFIDRKKSTAVMEDYVFSLVSKSGKELSQIFYKRQNVVAKITSERSSLLFGVENVKG